MIYLYQTPLYPIHENALNAMRGNSGIFSPKIGLFGTNKPVSGFRKITMRKTAILLNSNVSGFIKAANHSTHTVAEQTPTWR